MPTLITFFFVYLFGAVVVMPLAGVSGVFSWVVCSLAVTVLTYGGGYSKGAFYYTIYGLLLCIVTPYILSYVGIDVSHGIFEDPPPIAVWTPVIVLIFTNLGDFILSQVFGFYNHVPTRLT